MVESEPYERFGETLTERVGVIRWSGGDLPDLAFYDFGVRATFLLDRGHGRGASRSSSAAATRRSPGSSRSSRARRSRSTRPRRSPSARPPRSPTTDRTDGPARGDAGHLRRGERRPDAARSALQAVLLAGPAPARRRPRLVPGVALRARPAGVARPADGARLAMAPAAVTLTFNEPIGLATGGLRVLDSSGRRRGRRRRRRRRRLGHASRCRRSPTAGTW